MSIKLSSNPSFKAVYSSVNLGIRDDSNVNKAAFRFIHQLSRKQDTNYDYFVSGIHKDVPPEGIGYTTYGGFFKVDKFDKLGNLVKTSFVKTLSKSNDTVDKCL